MIDFDKSTIKLLRHINRNEGISEEKLLKKFGKDGTSMILIFLSNEMYLVPQDSNDYFFVYGESPWHSIPTTRYYTTPKAKVILENRQTVMIGDLRDWLTTSIAVAAFVKSFFF